MTAQSDTLNTGREIAKLYHDGDVKAIWSISTSDMQKAFVSINDLRNLRESIISNLGTEVEVLSEQTVKEADFDVYTRVGRWTGTAVAIEIVVATDELNKLAGFWIRPQRVAAHSPHLNYQVKSSLRLPVSDEWFVYWGGRTIEDNYHAIDLGQRFAMDLLVLKDGKSHKGDTASLDNYYCWGRPILAPATGIVVHATDGLPDQTIGASDPSNPAGNFVVIDFGNNEYGFLAHIQRNTVSVAVGDKVAKGQEIGLCGNSGNSSEPHLHFHLQTTPTLGEGEGLPAQFLKYQANGHLIERGEPIRGEIIKSTE